MLLKILFAHSLGDYFLQTDYLAMNKGKDKYILSIHAILYTLGVAIIFGNAINQFWYWVILLSHIGIDYLKASGITVKKLGNTKALVLDQVTHYIILLLAVML